jgi:hypothetical protein
MIKQKSIKLEVIPELEECIVPLQREEYTQLEKNIKLDGCREPLTIWQKNINKNILIDGHNRYKICNKYNISFKIIYIKFKNIEEAKIWIINNQLGRRNLNPDQLSYYRGLKYESLKKEKGGYKAFLAKGQNDILTSEKLAKEFKVSESTIKRDSKFAKGLEFIGMLNSHLKKRILNGEASVNKSNINILANPEFQKKIKSIINETDLENKINKIKTNFLKEPETQSGILNNSKNNIAEDIVFGREPLFANVEYRLKKIKGMILSNLNKAIKEKDITALEEIRKLVTQLEKILV